MTILGKIFFVVLFSISLYSCSKEKHVLLLSETNTSGLCYVGSDIEVELRGNPTTGYQWKLLDCESDILKFRGDTYTSDNPELMGAGGIFKFKFIPMRKGSTCIKFEYRRPWEKDVGKIIEFNIRIM